MTNGTWSYVYISIGERIKMFLFGCFDNILFVLVVYNLRMPWQEPCHVICVMLSHHVPYYNTNVSVFGHSKYKDKCPWPSLEYAPSLHNLSSKSHFNISKYWNRFTLSSWILEPWCNVGSFAWGSMDMFRCCVCRSFELILLMLLCIEPPPPPTQPSGPIYRYKAHSSGNARAVMISAAIQILQCIHALFCLKSSMLSFARLRDDAIKPKMFLFLIVSE